MKSPARFMHRLLLMIGVAAVGACVTPGDSSQREAARDGCQIAGCSDQVCSDQDSDDVVTTCEWRSVYACYRSARCERQLDGACGWTPTEELTTCLAAHSE